MRVGTTAVWRPEVKRGQLASRVLSVIVQGTAAQEDGIGIGGGGLGRGPSPITRDSGNRLCSS